MDGERGRRKRGEGRMAANFLTDN